jgi:hypothetical protein
MHERGIDMKRLGVWIVLTAGVMMMIPTRTHSAPSGWGEAELGPTLVQYDYGSPPPGAYPSGTLPEVFGRVGEILGAIDNPDRRSQLAEQWLQYSKQVIAKDYEYRQQWLDLQRRQLAQQQQTEALRLEVARLQMQIEELRAQNARLERENLLSQSRLGPTSGDRAARESGPPSPAPQGSAYPRSGQALWSSISALLFGAKPPAERNNETPK